LEASIWVYALTPLYHMSMTQGKKYQPPWSLVPYLPNFYKDRGSWCIWKALCSLQNGLYILSLSVKICGRKSEANLY
jgi:hypothetical protein